MAVQLAAPIFIVNLTIKQGAGATITLTVVDKDGKPYDVTTNLAVRAQIRASTGGPVLFEWNTTPGSGIGSAVVTYSPVTLTSLVTLTLTGAQTALFTPWTTALWDCFFTASGTEPVCLAGGSVLVIPWVTH